MRDAGEPIRVIAALAGTRMLFSAYLLGKWFQGYRPNLLGFTHFFDWLPMLPIEEAPWKPMHRNGKPNPRSDRLFSVRSEAIKVIAVVVSDEEAAVYDSRTSFESLARLVTPKDFTRVFV
jgi:hypothetical protein